MNPIYRSAILAAAALLLGSCSEDNWKPGPEAPATMGVYFNLLENPDVLILDDADRTATVTLGREKSADDATVPLKIISCPEGVTAPTSVEFAAGEKTASFQVSMKDMPSSTSGTLVMQIDPAYSDIYAAGTSEMSMNITVSAGWQLLADDLVLDHSSEYNSYTFPAQHTSLYVLDGANRFKIPDFLNSGLDFVFTVPEPNNDLPYIVPTTNCIFYEELYGADDDEYHSWYFYDTATASYPVWSIDNSDLMVNNLSFDSYEDGYQYDPETYVDILEGYGNLCTFIELSNGDAKYHFVDMTFTAKFNPFAK